MTKKEHIEYWIKSAEHDIESSKSIFKTKKYDWCLYVGHLALEKLLKALYIHNVGDLTIPRIHNLVRLAELADVKIDTETRLNMDRINDFNIETRYPDYKLEFYKKCTYEFSNKNLKLIMELYEWLRFQLK